MDKIYVNALLNQISDLNGDSDSYDSDFDKLSELLVMEIKTTYPSLNFEIGDYNFLDIPSLNLNLWVINGVIEIEKVPSGINYQYSEWKKSTADNICEILELISVYSISRDFSIFKLKKD